jgi:hypothetical protein
MKCDSYYIECPGCPIGIRVSQGRIARHERGLGYVPYGLYHLLEKRHPEDSSMTVKAQAKRQLCPASGKTPEEARVVCGRFLIQSIPRRSALTE